MEGKVKYIVQLKWIKPLKCVSASSTKLAEFIPLSLMKDTYISRKTSNYAVKVRVFLPDFVNIAKNLGFKYSKKNKLLYSDDREAYLKLLVYSVVRQSIRSEVKADMLARMINKMPYTEVRYWGSIFSRYFKTFKSRRALYRPAHAFKEVYGLTE